MWCGRNFQILFSILGQPVLLPLGVLLGNDNKPRDAVPQHMLRVLKNCQELDVQAHLHQSNITAIVLCLEIGLYRLGLILVLGIPGRWLIKYLSQLFTDLVLLIKRLDQIRLVVLWVQKECGDRQLVQIQVQLNLVWVVWYKSWCRRCPDLALLQCVRDHLPFFPNLALTLLFRLLDIFLAVKLSLNLGTLVLDGLVVGIVVEGMVAAVESFWVHLKGEEGFR